jgi:hypothetical protein
VKLAKGDVSPAAKILRAKTRSAKAPKDSEQAQYKMQMRKETTTSRIISWSLRSIQIWCGEEHQKEIPKRLGNLCYSRNPRASLNDPVDNENHDHPNR